jgi:hypothetical protein
MVANIARRRILAKIQFEVARSGSATEMRRVN